MSPQAPCSKPPSPLIQTSRQATGQPPVTAFSVTACPHPGDLSDFSFEGIDRHACNPSKDIRISFSYRASSRSASATEQVQGQHQPQSKFKTSLVCEICNKQGNSDSSHRHVFKNPTTSFLTLNKTSSPWRSGPRVILCYLLLRVTLHMPIWIAQHQSHPPPPCCTLQHNIVLGTQHSEDGR